MLPFKLKPVLNFGTRQNTYLKSKERLLVILKKKVHNMHREL